MLPVRLSGSRLPLERCGRYLLPVVPALDSPELFGPSGLNFFLPGHLPTPPCAPPVGVVGYPAVRCALLLRLRKAHTALKLSVQMRGMP